MKILGTSPIQAWEDQTIAAGTSAATLMQQAVTGLHREITNRFPPGRALIACGKGNNGNDALWLADSLQQSGWHTTIWLSHPQDERVSVDSQPDPSARAAEQALVFPETPYMGPAPSEPLLIIDGILGLGASGPPRGNSAEMIQWLREHRRPQDVCLSLDTPSGMDGDTGEIFTPCFHADFTIGIGAVKAGCLQPDAAPAVGRLSAVPISLADPSPAAQADFFTLEDARALITHRPSNTYKHRQGTVHLWAGSPGMCGAAILASRAALRAGAGLVRLFTPADLIPQMMTATPEVMVEPITTSVSTSNKLNPKFLDAAALLIGPGIGLSAATRDLFLQVVHASRSALVVDADGLTHCASEQQTLASLPKNSILTPHAGEFARIFPQTSGSRYEDAHLFTTLNPQLVLALKGPNTLVACHSSGLTYNGSGNPGMATAGSGDVLAGLIAGLLARGFSSPDATRLGVFWHGLAGDIAARTHSEDSLIAGDLIAALGAARGCISIP